MFRPFLVALTHFEEEGSADPSGKKRREKRKEHNDIRIYTYIYEEKEENAPTTEEKVLCHDTFPAPLRPCKGALPPPAPPTGRLCRPGACTPILAHINAAFALKSLRKFFPKEVDPLMDQLLFSITYYGQGTVVYHPGF